MAIFSSKTLLTAVIAAFSALVISGCAPTIQVDGNKYRALDKRETELMIGLARNHVKRNVPKVVSVHECDIILSTDPDMKIKYLGDLRGEARITWELPARRFTVLFIGEFLSRDMYCLFETIDKQPEMLDCRPKWEHNIPTVPGGAAPLPAPTVRRPPAAK